ncbi:type VI immunity family protein [Herbaspirillum sp. B65]|uniref:type VI immunity family protein n=1 Tax=Herbaspirillum sp. B65 TaxID=137708 RepID=UPI00034DE6F5|nr:type VI immunity family protein [Herbaspirillum sp. B65]
MSDLPFDPIQLMRDHPERMRIPGGLLTKQGAQDYVGSVPAITGTLFFYHAHLPDVREAICSCFDEYSAIAKDHLTWLLREEPPSGPDRFPYRDAPPLRGMVKQMNENDLMSFVYTSGSQPFDAGDWEFQVFGRRGWEAKMKSRGTSVLRFSLPLLFVEENPTAFQKLFVSFARRLNAIHGYGGYGLVLSALREEKNQPFEAYLSEKLKGFDAGDPVGGSRHAKEGIKTVSWLTAVNYEMVKQVGGITTIRSELPMDWFAIYGYGNGLIVQAGPKPNAAPTDQPMPASLVLSNFLFKEVRSSRVSLHNTSVDGEPRLIGWAADQWLKRFDIDESQLISYKAKLLDEPKLTKESTLADRAAQ